ncbi:MAG: PAS domain-containing sensor histidine kinase, partial [Hymenobacter sp.]|nr:PAS domain-containing sensor histidine kinase [Hymenobacter sp.]
MPATPLPLPAGSLLPAELLQPLLDVSLAALAVLRPLHEPAGQAPTDFTLEYLNPAGQRLMGLPERPAATLRTHFPHAVATGLFAFCCRVFATGEAGHYRLRYPHKGRYWPVRLAARRRGPLLLVSFVAANDKLHGVNQGLVDANAALLITQGQQQQLNDALEVRVAERTQALRAAVAEAEVKQRHLHNLFDQAPMAITVVRGPRYVIELANPVVCAMWGRTQQQAVGTPLFELLPEAAGQGFEQLFDGVMATGQPHVAYEIPSLIDRYGRRDTVYWDFTFQPLREATGEVTGVTVLATEVSERVMARRHLAAQRQLQAVFEQVPVAVGVFAGPAYLVDVCNPGLQAIWGRTAEQALNRPLFEVLPEIRDQGFKELLDEVVRTGVPYQAHEVPLQVLHAGRLTTVHVNFVYHPLRDAQGHIMAIAAVATDVSEQVAARQLVQQLNEANVQRLNQELAASNEELRSSNQELVDSNQQLVRTNADLDNFIYTASHDLKMPITNIEGLLQALQEELPATVREFDHVQAMLDMMQANVKRFQLTIVQLTDLSQLQQVHVQLAETVGLTALVEAVRLDLGPVLAAAGADLVVDVTACSTGAFSA